MIKSWIISVLVTLSYGQPITSSEGGFDVECISKNSRSVDPICTPYTTDPIFGHLDLVDCNVRCFRKFDDDCIRDKTCYSVKHVYSDPEDICCECNYEDIFADCNNRETGIQVPTTRRTTVANKRRPTTTRSKTVPTKRRTTSSIILESMKKSCGHRPPIDLTVAVNEGQVNAPFAVSIGKYFQNEFKHHCTGSVLAPEIILSAAHCITSQYFDRESFKIRAGVEDLESHHAVERKIRKAVFHSQWQRSGRKNIYFDICLIFLESPLPFTPSIQPICLPIQTFHSLPASKVGDGITTVGWGRDNEDVVGKEITQIDVTVRTNDECNFKYNHTDRRDKIRLQRELPNLLKASQFCADNNANKGIGTCHGDSGGPSFIRNFENGMEKFTIFGVTSGSISCGGGLPDFYTFLAQEEILPWIHKAASEDEQTRSEFNHLRDNSWVHCEIDTECAYGNCNDGVCIQTLAFSEAHSIGPSSKCPDDKKPCYVGNECTSAVCNRYGNSCWCPQNKRKRSAEKNIEKENIPKEMSFVTGKPYQWDIECRNEGDCPIDWFCEELFCYAPLTFPSAAWEALSAPVVGRIGTLTASAPLGSVSPNCLCKPDCTSPICNSLSRCWCAAKGWGVPRHG